MHDEKPKPPYQAPKIERYSPFFASSPAKLPGLVQGIDAEPETRQTSGSADKTTAIGKPE